MHRAILVAPTVLAVARAGFECSAFIAPVTITAPSFPPAFPPFNTHYDSVHFLNAITARNASTASPFAATVNVTETFDISAEYCRPLHSSDNGNVQVLTHGLGFDKGYWNLFGAQSPYNYIRVATENGYSTLSYDRIGNGFSSIVDPYSIQQAPVELAVLAALTTKLRDGTLDAGVPKPTGKVLHVGHSYGSTLSNALAAAYPDLSDGLALTGYSVYQGGQGPFLIGTLFHLVKENQPSRFGNRSTGSLTWGDEEANQYSFLAWPFFDPAVLAYAEANKFPFSLGEILTGGILSFNASSFNGPVLVLSGDADLIFCNGDCHGILEQVATLFPEASPFETYVQPSTGHGINLHYNATGAFQTIQNFFKAHT